jgi:putative nucleotidyltransferase with HDIG domain
MVDQTEKKMKTILVVDDDEMFRGMLASVVTKFGYKAVEAESGGAAQSLLGLGGVDAVVSDISMPGISGLELTKYIKTTTPLPVILMTGFADLIETQAAAEYGADGFIAKPFKKEELAEALKLCFQLDPNPDAPENIDDTFCCISIDDFVTGKEIQYDIYIRLSDQKYIKIAHQGENISSERILAYKEKKLRFLYMTKEDFRRYLGFSVSLAKLVRESSKVSRLKKLNFLKHTTEVILQHVHQNGVDAESFNNARAVTETTISMITDQKDAFDLLSVLQSHSDYLYAHSVGVSVYSTIIARKMHWHSPMTLFKISMGGLFHDIGKKEIDKAILEKSRAALSSEEVRLFETHTVRGLEILSKTPSIPEDVIQIALHHHENCLGAGYPAGLKKNHIHPMARVVSVANEFCSLVLKGPNNPGMAPEAAMTKMIALYSETLDQACFGALRQSFNLK